MNRARALIVLALLLALVAVIFTPIGVRIALAVAPLGDLKLSAGRVGGWIGNPTLGDVHLSAPGIRATAQEVSARYGIWPLFRKELRFSLRLEGAEVNLDPSRFGPAGPDTGWKVIPERLEVEDVQLAVRGLPFDLPDARAQIVRITPSEHGGQAELNAEIESGRASAMVDYRLVGDELSATAQINGEARILNYWWSGVRGGRLSGEYRLEGGQLTGDLLLEGGEIEVPGAEWVTGHRIGGTLQQRGDRIDVLLRGRAFNGPVEARAYVDTREERWAVSGILEPNLGNLAGALGIEDASGRARATVEASGWESAEVRASVRGQGSVSGIPFEALKADYRFDGVGSSVALEAQLGLLNEAQRLRASLSERRGRLGVDARLEGALLGRPLALEAQLRNRVLDVSGEVSGGRTAARYQLDGGRLSGRLDALLPAPLEGGVGVSFAGPIERVALTVSRADLNLPGLPLALRGSGYAGTEGAELDLGALGLRLDDQGRGSWRASNLEVEGGGLLSGQGELNLNDGEIRGQLEARRLLPGAQTLSGPVAVNLNRQSADWAAGRARLSWRGERLEARFDDWNFDLGGPAALNGTARYDRGRLGGTLNLTVPEGELALRGNGTGATLSGSYRGFAIGGNAVLEPLSVRLSASGPGLRLEADYRRELALTLRSGARLERVLRGRWSPEQELRASGEADLGALGALAGVDARGRLTLDLRGQSGRGRLEGELAGFQAQADLRLESGRVQAEMSAGNTDVQLNAAGQVYPELRLGGRAEVAGARLQLSASGPYDRAAFAASGTSPRLAASDLVLPAQPLRLAGTLTPRLTAVGSLGDLQLRYAEGELIRASGQPRVLFAGRPVDLRLNAAWNPQWQGSLRLEGRGEGFDVRASGPWSALSVFANLRGPQLRLQASGEAALPDGRYRLRGSASALDLSANVSLSGRGSDFSAQADVRDRAGGRAQLSARGLENFSAELRQLTVQGVSASGRLTARGGVLDGELSGEAFGNPFTLALVRGALDLQAQASAAELSASGRFRLPADLTGLHVTLRSEYGTARLSGSLRGGRGILGGSLNVPAQRLEVPLGPLELNGTQARLRLGLGTAITLALEGQGGQLRYGPQGWSGRYALGYRYGDAGRLELAVSGQELQPQLNVNASGPLRGRLRLGEALSGELALALGRLEAQLPESALADTRLGELRLNVSGSLEAPRAALSLQGTRYLGRELNLTARAAQTAGGFSASGELRSGTTRLPFTATQDGLDVRGAYLDAALVEPFVDGLRGSARLDLSLPRYELARGQGTLVLDLARGIGEAVNGRVDLRSGQLSANLQGHAGGRRLSLRGPVYPNANATLSVEGVSGQLVGADGRYRLSAAGDLEGRPLTLDARLDRELLTVSGAVAGARLSLEARVAENLEGRFELDAADLEPLLGEGARGGQLSVRGRIAGPERITAQASGRLQDTDFSGELLWDGRALSLGAARVAGNWGAATPAGQVFPALDLRAGIRLERPARADLELRASGSLQDPRLQASGTLLSDPYGLEVSGTTLSGRLQGNLVTVDLGGERLSGQVQARLQGGLELVSARLRPDTTLRQGELELALRGDLSYAPESGFAGGLSARGQVGRESAELAVTGQGDLSVVGGYGPGRFSGTLGRDILERPRAQLALESLDLGAWWGRPRQLAASGRFDLGGRWERPELSIDAHLNDLDRSNGDLSAQLEGRANPQVTHLILTGPELRGTALLQGGRWQANLTALDARLAPLLPPDLGVNSALLRGSLEAAGRLDADVAVERVTLFNLDARVVSRDLGEVRAAGRLNWTPQALGGELSAALLGGSARISGALPEAVTVSLEALDLQRFGLGRLGGQARLSGPASDPRLSGELQLVQSDARITLGLGGRVSQPDVLARADLTGTLTGQVRLDLRDLSFDPPGAELALSADLRSEAGRLNASLRGRWPQLSGEANFNSAALPAPVRLSAAGNGSYRLEAGALGGGSFEILSEGSGLGRSRGSLDLRPLALAQSTSGTASVRVGWAGELLRPSFTLEGETRGVAVDPVTLGDLTLGGGGTLDDLSVRAAQQGREVLTFRRSAQDAGALHVQDLALGLLGGDARVSGSYRLDSASGELSLRSSGALAGTAQVELDRDLHVAADLSYNGLHVNADARRTEQGWRGHGQLSGLPRELLPDGLAFDLTGPADAPQLRSSFELAGSNARLEVSPTLSVLTLADGPQAQASGSWRYQGGQLSGQLDYARAELSARLNASGTLEDPRVALELRSGEALLSGTAGLNAGDLRLQAGSDGRIRWTGQQVQVNIPGFELDALQQPDIAGTLRATGTLGAQDGRLELSFSDLQTPLELAMFGWQLDGDLNATVTRTDGRLAVSAEYAGTPGRARAELGQSPQGPLQGTLSADLTSAQGGTVSARLTAANRTLSGQVLAQGLLLRLGETEAVIGARADLSGQNFTLEGNVAAGGGTLTVSADGGVADLLPAAESLLGLAPTEDGYLAQARLQGVDLRALRLSDHISGRVTGVASFSPASSTFNLRAPELNLAGTVLPVRLEGTASGSDWRLRGALGDSAVVGNITEGVLSARVDLRAAPLHAFLGAFSGPLPGQAEMTGLARYEGPLAAPLEGRLGVVAERVEVRSGNEQLRGQGQLTYDRGTLRVPGIQLAGSGRWNIAGEYSPQRVDLTATFENTTFTPVLSILPNVRALEPLLSGNLSLRLNGSYQRPSAQLTGSALRGRIDGIDFVLPQIGGSLSNGVFSFGAPITTRGELNASLGVSGAGRFENGELRGTQVQVRGNLAAPNTGRVDNLDALISQDPAGEWRLEASARSGGTLRLTGSLSPQLALDLRADRYSPVLTGLPVRNGEVSGALSAREEGERYVVRGSLDVTRLLIGTTAQDPQPNNGSPDSASDPNAVPGFVSPLPPEFTTFPEPEQEPNATTPPPASATLRRVVFEDIRVNARSGIRIDENLARAEFGGSVVLSGTAADPRLSGQVSALRGSVFLRENEFRIQRGLAVWDGSGPYPSFELVATGEVIEPTRDPVTGTNSSQRLQVTVTITGRFTSDNARQPKLDLQTTFASNPPRDQDTLYALLAFGTTDLTQVPELLTSSAINTALNVFILGEFERGVARALGVDVFRIRTNLLNLTGLDPALTAEFTVGTYITREFYLQYQVDLTGTGLLDAQYTTPDGRFNFRVSTPLSGLDFSTVRPSFSVAYNFTPSSSVQFGVETGVSTRLRLGYQLRF
ncbi:uncharacterized protein involved in outer membrane biogenesis [Deinobacterium chartae]|uniref:Uncharacterized protein involved in outer membrane biogenesis n=1 Tax=Deinobacterium chartae TaxID=521158 RepID=A0A841HUR7_9DEIO|nr:translocation/assembly module TamB domain-containing protein [Deinobacterium chartae]MBB6096666.1 uncharacterized protein involved in outer membrane biogenesis [Deinobacterium chartae]